MPLDIATAESAYLGGATKFDDWLEKFEFEWNKPMLETQVGEYLRDMDPQTKQLLKQFMPKEMGELEKKYGG